MSASPRRRTSRSLVYGLGMLRQFSAEQPVRSISELAELMEVSRPTAHRYASTCLELGYLEQAPKRRYRLARKSAEVGVAMVGSLALTECSGPILRELRDETGRTVSLAVLDGEDVVYLQRCRGFERGHYELEAGLGSGSRLPASCTAAGRALLGALRTGAGGGAAEPGSLSVASLAMDARARTSASALASGLAAVVAVEGQRMCAIEITAPAEALSPEQMIASLSGPLQQAVASLRAALVERRSREGVPELSS
jgi:IclR helix-turn-helix domain